MLKYNTYMLVMETMAFINAVMQDYEKYMRLMAKGERIGRFDLSKSVRFRA